MYSTCIFCHSRLGANEVVEEFPVGRRLAFDPGKGRLWVLCPRCRQWNLSPIEERWEALEALERLYRDTPRRYGTEQIGLAKHAEGLELVRIGQPTRPEYAAWRYGGELVRRRRRLLVTGGLALAGGIVVAGGASALVAGGGGLAVFNLGMHAFNLYNGVVRTAARVEIADGRRLVLKERHAQRARIHPGEGSAWRLSFPYVGREEGTLRQLRYSAGRASVANDPVATLEGEAAVRAAAKILPALNRSGASRRLVEDAARFVETHASPDAAFVGAFHSKDSPWRTFAHIPKHSLYRLPASVRLGLEMAAQEETERRALEGELARLEAEWRAAEEVAAIADDLLLPERIRRIIVRK